MFGTAGSGYIPSRPLSLYTTSTANHFGAPHRYGTLGVHLDYAVRSFSHTLYTLALR